MVMTYTPQCVIPKKLKAPLYTVSLCNYQKITFSHCFVRFDIYLHNGDVTFGNTISQELVKQRGIQDNFTKCCFPCLCRVVSYICDCMS
jgi:hypothetical protein